jgi:hypothetical protein
LEENLMLARMMLIVSAFVAVLGITSFAGAQGTVSNYAATQLKSLQRANSAEQFSVSRINNQILNQGIPRAGVAGVNLQNTGRSAAFAAPRPPLVGGGGMASGNNKPFSRIDRGPTVSPYLALNNPFSTAEDYYNIVRPLQEQRQTNDAFSRQQYIQQRKLNQLAAEGPFQITGDPNATPTGHGSGFMRLGTYMNTGNYFAPPTQPKGSR